LAEVKKTNAFIVCCLFRRGEKPKLKRIASGSDEHDPAAL